MLNHHEFIVKAINNFIFFLNKVELQVTYNLLNLENNVQILQCSVRFLIITSNYYFSLQERKMQLSNTWSEGRLSIRVGQISQNLELMTIYNDDNFFLDYNFSIGVLEAYCFSNLTHSLVT